jgi:superfamily I DNA and/or RNA helicase
MSENEVESEVPVTHLKDATEQRNESLLDNLVQKRKNLDNKETFINIPGYDDEPPIMKAKYRLLDGKEIDNIMTKVQKETKNQWDRQVLSAVDMFIAACEGMFVDIGDGALEPYPMKVGDKEILGYNEDLAAALELEEVNTARQTVFGVFANNEAAIMQHNVKLSLWMSNTSRKVDEDFLGLI